LTIKYYCTYTESNAVAASNVLPSNIQEGVRIQESEFRMLDCDNVHEILNPVF